MLDNLVLDLMHAILDSWLKIPKKVKADQKTYACTSMNEEKKQEEQSYSLDREQKRSLRSKKKE